jgi:hypothetical protein
VNIPFNDVGINMYRRQSYVKLSNQGQLQGPLSPSNDTSILKFKSKILSSRFYREIDSILRGKEGQGQAQGKVHIDGAVQLSGFRDRMIANALRKALSPEGMATHAKKLTTLTKFEAMMASGKEGTKRLMLFTHLRHTYPNSDPMRFRRNELAVASWVTELVGKIDSLIVRIVLMVSAPQECVLLVDRFNKLDDAKSDNTTSSTTSTSSSNLISETSGTKVLCLPTVPCTHPSLGIPTLDCMLKYAATAAHPGEAVMYVRPGVVLRSDLGFSILKLASSNQFPRGFIATGRSIDAVVSSKDLIGNIVTGTETATAGVGAAGGSFEHTRPRIDSFHREHLNSASAPTATTIDVPLTPFLKDIVSKWSGGQPSPTFRQDYIILSSGLNIFNASAFSAAAFIDGSNSVTAIRLVASADAVLESTADKKVLPFVFPALESEWLRLERGEASSARYAFNGRCDGSLACEIVAAAAGGGGAPTKRHRFRS